MSKRPSKLDTYKVRCAELEAQNATLCNELEAMCNKFAVVRNENVALRNELEALRNEFAVVRNDKAALRNELEALRNKFAVVRNENAALRNENVALRNENVALRNGNEALQANETTYKQTITELQEKEREFQEKEQEHQEKERELQRKAGRNSHNSSQPPSQDEFGKPQSRTHSLRKKSGRKPGGQAGHTGAHMVIPHKPDDVKQHLPATCLKCSHFSECIQKGNVFACGEKRYEVNVVINTKVTEHQTLEVKKCPYGENVKAAAFPEGIRAHVQYGDSVSVLVGLLNTYGAVSVNRIHTLLSSLMGVSLSPGTIVSMISQCATKVGETLTTIKEMLTKENVVHFDETGTNVNGKTIWVHNSSNPSLTYQTIDEKRGQEGMENNGVLPNFKGIGVHDCWQSYWKYNDIQHGVCCAHLLRELNGIEEFESDHAWATLFKELLMNMKRAKEKTIERGKGEISRYYDKKFDQEYDEIMAEAEKTCPPPPEPPDKKKGKKKKGKARALVERLIHLKESICMFLHDFRVPFDNNQAERDVRNVKTKTKVSGCFRTKGGAQDYLNIMSYLSTGMKHGISVFEALTSAFAGNGAIVLQ